MTGGACENMEAEAGLRGGSHAEKDEEASWRSVEAPRRGGRL